MSIWRRVLGSIRGGWKTHGPGASSVDGAFSSDEDYDQFVQAECALRLSAFWACVNLRAETVGSLPLHLRDKNKNIIREHDLYDVIHNSPNSMQTSPEFWSMMTANVDMHGNGYSEIVRRSNKSIISLEPPIPVDEVELMQRKSGRYYYKVGQTREIEIENMFHMKGFAIEGFLGISRLEAGRQILSSQISANKSAQIAFKQGLKVGGFFEMEQNLDDPQLEKLKSRLAEYGKSENGGKWMTLLKGMKPVAGASFRVKPAEAELLASRYMGIEEICRLLATPPQLIGHSDKASSWASSLEQVNLFYMAYGLQPGLVRTEQRIVKSLLSISDRAKGIEPRFAMQMLNRVDMKSKLAFYASALQNGYYNRNEIRDFEERAGIEGGEKYTVQLNMADLKDMPEGDDENGKVKK